METFFTILADETVRDVDAAENSLADKISAGSPWYSEN